MFGAEVNEALLYEVVKAQRATRRGGNASSKGRAEVAGSSQKMYRQKGTGNARHGGIRAQSFVGGGKAHGPKPRRLRVLGPPRKMRKGALKSALSLRSAEGQLTIVDAFELEDPKTKGLAKVLDALNVAKTRSSLMRATRSFACRLATCPRPVPEPRGRQRLRPAASRAPCAHQGRSQGHRKRCL